MSNRHALFLEIAMLAVMGTACTSGTSLGRNQNGSGGVAASGGAAAGAGGSPAGGGGIAVAGGTSGGGAGGRNSGGTSSVGGGGSPSGGASGLSGASGGSDAGATDLSIAPDSAVDGTADAGKNDAAVGACSQATTQVACEARSDCHPVFSDPGTCGCATPGCCARFSVCADGGKALCTMPATMGCAIATPHCEGPYVVSYSKICYEGCALQTECSAAVALDASAGVDTSSAHDTGLSCSAAFTSALTKDCTSDADCTLAKHGDCCGNVVMGIRSGSTAAFSAAEQTFQACACTLPTGCFHPDMAEDGSQVGTVGASFVARCQSNRCTSTVTATGVSCTTDADCPGQVCVAYVSHTGPTTSTKRECQSNPCNNVAASCGCASGLCTTAGFPLCSVVGTQLTCDDGRQ
jgi:hypothetical protein